MYIRHLINGPYLSSYSYIDRFNNLSALARTRTRDSTSSGTQISPSGASRCSDGRLRPERTVPAARLFDPGQSGSDETNICHRETRAPYFYTIATAFISTRKNKQRRRVVLYDVKRMMMGDIGLQTMGQHLRVMMKAGTFFSLRCSCFLGWLLGKDRKSLLPMGMKIAS